MAKHFKIVPYWTWNYASAVVFSCSSGYDSEDSFCSPIVHFKITFLLWKLIERLSVIYLFCILQRFSGLTALKYYDWFLKENLVSESIFDQWEHQILMSWAVFSESPWEIVKSFFISLVIHEHACATGKMAKTLKEIAIFVTIQFNCNLIAVPNLCLRGRRAN